MKITLDTNFIVSATLWESSVAKKLLISLIRNNIELFTTKEILNEYERVLARDFDYTKEEIEKRVQQITEALTVVEPTVHIEAVKDDPADNKILECAVSSNSDYIVSYDKHLLRLKEYENIKIITPEEANKSFRHLP